MGLFNDFQAKLNHQHYLIAFSGGLDSTALLSLFVKSREIQPHLQLRAIHVHHGLSANADQWLTHCQQICHQLAIPLISKKVNVDKKNGIEQGAREARYQAIHEARLPNEVVATAHHQQDQTETFFLALKRGSGVKGLSAMQTESELFGMPIFRPLLSCSKARLEDFVRAQNLPWIEDESNEDNQFDRNFLRNQVLPQLCARWSSFDQQVQRAAQHCYEQQQLVNELLAEEFDKNYREADRTFSVCDFVNDSLNKQNALLRMWFERLGFPMLSEMQLAQVRNNVIFARPDSSPQFTFMEYSIRRYQGRLYFIEKLANVTDFSAELDIEKTVELPDFLGSVTLTKNAENLTALWRTNTHEFESRLPLTHEKIILRFGYSGTVKLHEKDLNRDIKKVWQNLGVPPWQRTRIPLIFYGDRLKSAVGFFENFKA